MALKDRFEGIANDGAMTESEAIKVCVTYNRELQKEVEHLKANQKESKLDKLLTEYLHWCHSYDPAGMVVAHVIGGGAIVGFLWLIALLGTYGFSEFKRISTDTVYQEAYYMSGDNMTLDGKNVPCYQIMFAREDGSHVRGAPCIPNRDEAFSTIERLQAIQKAGKTEKEGKPNGTEPIPVR